MPKRQAVEIDLSNQWSLHKGELLLLRNKSGATRLGFAVLLKYFGNFFRFPAESKEVSPLIVRYLATQLGIEPAQWATYDFESRVVRYHRQEIRKYFGFREITEMQSQELGAWMREQVRESIPLPERLIESAYGRCKERLLEPPSKERLERLARSAIHANELKFSQKIYALLSTHSKGKLNQFLEPFEFKDVKEGATPASEIEEEDEGLPRALIHFLKSGPGPANLESVTRESKKLKFLRDTRTPKDLFMGIPGKALLNLKRRCAVEEPFELERHPVALKMTLLAAFDQIRQGEITDNLADLLIAITHKIGVRAKGKLDKQLLEDLKRVPGKAKLLYKVAKAVVGHSEGKVGDVLFPEVSEAVLEAIIKEFESTGQSYEQKLRTVVLRSYGSHYRRMLPRLLADLVFRTNNPAFEPLIEAAGLFEKYLGHNAKWYPLNESIPLDGIKIDENWRDFVFEEDKDGNHRVCRLPYEVAVLQNLREQILCREIWIEGAIKYRNPDEDLPQDFEQKRDRYYGDLGLARDPWEFIKTMRGEMREELLKFNKSLPRNPDIGIKMTGKKGWIKMSPVEPQSPPLNLEALKAELNRRWPQTSLLDVLKEAALRSKFLESFKTPTVRENLDETVRNQRLLLCLYGLGTNAGLKRMCDGMSETVYKDLLYTRRRLISQEGLREAIRRVLNATFRERMPEIWGEGSSACASDSKKFSAWDGNLMSEYHIRYGGRGVMIYWHVDRKAACIYSQLKACSSSEVASMIEGVLRHCTEMSVDRQYADTHGASEVAFAFSRLLSFQLLPRLKGIHIQKLYRPDPNSSYSNLGPILERPINWGLIARNYDAMVKHVAALKVGTATAESIMSKFTRKRWDSDLYRAFSELGRATKTLFLCRYLGARALRREIHEGLNVIENWNSANNFIFFGKGGEMSSNQFDDHEESMLCLHLLQSSLVYVNTLMLQKVLEGPSWDAKLTAEDLRGISPLVYAHVTPYGAFHLDMKTRIPIEEGGEASLASVA
jgi:TnpA family transposase